MNPPYGKKARLWMERLADHGSGIALIFARTDTELFKDTVWDVAHAVLFLQGRLRFLLPDGKPAPHNSGAPSALVAFGKTAVERLRDCKLPGKFIQLNPYE